MAPSYKVTYFDLNALGEPIRVLLSYGSLEFEDVRIKYKDWPDLKPKMPYGQLPILECDGKVAHQHIAICRYLAKKVKLTGKDDWEDLTIDATVETVNDLRIKVAQFYYEHDGTLRKKLQETLMNETIPYYIGKLEAQAKENGGYLALPKLTWADVYFTSLIDYINVLVDNDIIAKAPNLQAVKNKVWSVPNIKKWMDKRPQTFKLADFPPPPK
ncbi:unnamed protein product [Acanthoscelides obtectus]|uniref:glutathione transferase n=2 Tax=Acanthoscelides obtectus TaxID=200917 RepID=A0A9P0JLH5_ACAOB|nr:unnamed protein product [Acanthoscelides obtectus]CAH1953385.1 unnamed protein product [Acanthoscelides obtectus]CAK1661304.1 hypothetical protein AOBTE_LOCUS22559 [Acanthoscelides obtectus]CAK1661306.1 hypothetical protein AOBTE_LOCUS22560 [Acanthoscelides obtectus]